MVLYYPRLPDDFTSTEPMFVSKERFCREASRITLLKTKWFIPIKDWDEPWSYPTGILAQAGEQQPQHPNDHPADQRVDRDGNQVKELDHDALE